MQRVVEPSRRRTHKSDQQQQKSDHCKEKTKGRQPVGFKDLIMWLGSVIMGNWNYELAWD